MKIVVLFPTSSEAKYFNREGVIVSFCGVGLSASAYGTYKAITEHSPDVIIMAGIAGVYKGAPYKIGDTFIVESECEADLGFFFEDGFKHLSSMNLDMDFEIINYLKCPYINDDIPLPRVKSISMNSAMSPHADTSKGEIENMEGSAFFYVCMKENQKFFEIRSISNTVDFGRDDWDYESSIKNMTKGINTLIDYLEQ